MSEVQTAASVPMSESELLALIKRQQESIFNADMMLRMLLRKLGDRAVLKPHEIHLVQDLCIQTDNDADGNFVMSLVEAEPEVLQ